MVVAEQGRLHRADVLIKVGVIRGDGVVPRAVLTDHKGGEEWDVCQVVRITLADVVRHTAQAGKIRGNRLAPDDVTVGGRGRLKLVDGRIHLRDHRRIV